MIRKIIVVQKLNCIKKEKEKESFTDSEAKGLLIWKKQQKAAGKSNRSVSLKNRNFQSCVGVLKKRGATDFLGLKQGGKRSQVQVNRERRGGDQTGGSSQPTKEV